VYIEQAGRQAGYRCFKLGMKLRLEMMGLGAMHDVDVRFDKAQGLLWLWAGSRCGYIWLARSVCLWLM
jgi:hypothetical protein